MSEPSPAAHREGETLADWLPRLLDQIELGWKERRHGFHTPVLLTRGLDDAPEGRTVVLRASGRDPVFVQCHTDARSPKIAELERDPRARWVLYDREAKLQLRLSGTTEIHRGGSVHEAAWAATRLFARRCYLAPRAPGAPVEAPDPNLPSDLLGREPTPEESAPGTEQFAVLRTHVNRVDALSLQATGHTRAAWTLDPETGAVLEASWLAV